MCSICLHKKCSCVDCGIESDIKKNGVKPVIPVESEYYYDSDDTVAAMDNFTTTTRTTPESTDVDRCFFLYSFGFRR
jgi:hypothetical protein